MFGAGAVALGVIVAGVGLGRSDGPTPQVTQTTVSAGASKDEAPRIMAAELMALAKKGEAVLIDVRSADAYAASHIPGAINIPYNSLEARLGELPKEKLIGLYCT
jgi:3-mercaptopyruvate sulfurtransferase SseA